MLAVQLTNTTSGLSTIGFTDALDFGQYSILSLTSNPFHYDLQDSINCSSYLLYDMLRTNDGTFAIIFDCLPNGSHLGGTLGVFIWNRNSNVDGTYVGQVPFNPTYNFLGATIANNVVIVLYSHQLLGGSPGIYMTQINAQANPYLGLNTTMLYANASSTKVSFQRNSGNYMIMAYEVQGTGQVTQIQYDVFCLNKQAIAWQYFRDSFSIPLYDVTFGFTLGVSVDAVCNVGFLVQNSSDSIYGLNSQCRELSSAARRNRTIWSDRPRPRRTALQETRL